MSINTERYVVPFGETRIDYLKTALTLAAELHSKLRCSGEIILLVPSKDQVEHSTLATAFGSLAIKNLLKNRPVEFKGNCYWKLESVRSFKHKWNAEIIVGVYAYQEMLDEIDRIPGVKAVIIAPWIMDDLTQWIRTWNPTIVGQEKTSPDKLIENPIVEEALKLITGRINLSTGLSHPSDHDYTVGLLRCLNKYVGLETPGSVRAWAVRNNWPPKHADDLAGIVRSLTEGKRIRGGKNFGFNKKTIKMLQDRLEGN